MNDTELNDKFAKLLEKMESLNEKYINHARYDAEYFDEIRGNITKILNRLDNLEICKVTDAKS